MGYVSHNQMVEKIWLWMKVMNNKNLGPGCFLTDGTDCGFSHRGLYCEKRCLKMLKYPDGLASSLLSLQMNIHMHCTSACVYNDVELLVFPFFNPQIAENSHGLLSRPRSVTIRYQSGSKSKSSVPGKTWLNDHWAHQKSKVSSWHGKPMKNILRSEAKNLAKSCINLPRSGMTLELSCDLKQHCQAAQDI